MNEFRALAWKEWREVRAYLWIALGIFVGLPFIGAIEGMIAHPNRFEIITAPWVFTLGGVLAVFVAVGVTCRDLQPRLEDFWRSRPVSAVRWMVVKFFIGLTVVLIACVVPMLVELISTRGDDSESWWFLALWAALYSVAFLIGCLIRRTAHAGMLALAAMLLIYLLPMVLPPLRWLFTAWGTLALASAAFVVALVATARGWRVESGKKLMYGSISAAILILFASAGFQLGTNLPILQQVDLPEGETAQAIGWNGTRGHVVTFKWLSPLTLKSGEAHLQARLRSLELINSQVKLGDPIDVPQLFAYREMYDRDASPEKHPNIRYYVDSTYSDKEERTTSLTLHAMRFDDGSDLEIARLPDDLIDEKIWPTLYSADDRLYVLGKRLLVYDTIDPLKPRLVSDQPFDYAWSSSEPLGGSFTLQLPQVPGLSARQRLEAALRTKTRWHVFDGDLLIRFDGSALEAARLSKLSETAATFEHVDRAEPTMLETLFGAGSFGGIKTSNGYLYASGSPSARYFNPQIKVFDTRGPKPLKLVAHFAAPGVGAVCPLPDGRALVGGSKIWLVGPPPNSK